MSIAIITDAFRTKVGNAGTKLVLIKLADNASDEGDCWPSHRNIAEQCDMSVRTVIRHIDRLVQLGMVSKQPRIIGNKQTSNTYQIHPKAPESGVSDCHLGGVTVSPGGCQDVTRGGDKLCHTESPSLNPHMNHGEAERTGKQSSTPAKRKHEMPDDFVLTEARKEKLRNKAPGLDPDQEWEKFCNYHLMHNNKYANWDRAWSSWAIKAKDFNKGAEQEQPRKRKLM